MANRPLSPHLSIYKWGPHMLASILHRISGDGFALVGLPVLLWWLGSLAAGAESYAGFVRWVDNPLGYIVLVGLSWAYFNHLCSGLRHFVLDIGAGYELQRNRAWSIASIVGGVVLTAAFWAVIVLR
jgi:succinate dehydrogenase / fumarate reductase cytochrome b subunit